MAFATEWPRISALGTDGFLVTFADRLSEPANRAALAFRHALEQESWRGVEETSTSLVSAYLRFDPRGASHAEIQSKLQHLLARENWFEVPLPQGRRLWRVPAVFGTELAPQLEEAAQAAGLTPEDAVASLTQTRVRVQTIGFAPGQPYLGELPPAWDIPRQSQLTSQVPAGALAVAIRQLVLFPVPAPTGWRHVGQTCFQLFRPDSDDPFVLRPGDELQFEPVGAETLARMQSDPGGGARAEVIR
ncbi:allophanate hydrolase [Leisingera sp. ANG-M1]|uniref:5-oxoprolinase subunit B family protein n=1 Tax=Leisingera sp. ANG-M1 TaxID=1577895 RepID=UPI00057D36C3|nr:allophanate hydrolase subunit 1 [Leisingera sp. ANG-M1]KIC10974.1 allophanate hydrolase [Leisingera sp. ANG-M1]